MKNPKNYKPHKINKQAVHIISVWSLIFICVSIFAIIILAHFNLDTYIIIPTVVISVSCSILASAIYSYQIDMQRELDDFRDFIISVASSNAFLEKLDAARLQNLRSGALSQLRREEFPNMQQGLIDLDKELFNTLTMPFYEFFRESFQYDYDVEFDWGNDLKTKCIHKRHHLEYLLKSPRVTGEPDLANIGIRKSMFCPVEDIEPKLSEIIKIEKFTVNIDNTRNVDIRQHLIMSYSDQEPCEYYNKCINIHLDSDCKLTAETITDVGDGLKVEKIPDINNNKLGINVSFKDDLKVIIEYDIYVPIEDIHYTNRLKYPAQSYRIDCYCKQSGMKFYGQLLGTFTRQSKISSTSIDTSFSIESYDWLLPRNGVYVILIKK